MFIQRPQASTGSNRTEQLLHKFLDIVADAVLGQRPVIPQIVCEFKDMKSGLDKPQNRKGNTRTPVPGARLSACLAFPKHPQKSSIVDLNPKVGLRQGAIVVSEVPDLFRSRYLGDVMTHQATAAIRRGLHQLDIVSSKDGAGTRTFTTHRSARPRLLDLFCCAGGAAVGYDRAGFEVVGVDIVDRPNFPFEFKRANALELDLAFLASFDAIHASPPCQSYSDLAKRNGNGHMWPRLIEPVREMLLAAGRPYVIENVQGAPLIDPVVLCGTMFPELRVIRHRLFEASFNITPPPHRKHPKVHTFDKRKSHFGKTNEWTDFVQVTGGGNCTLAAARDAMGIDWMTKGEINEAIPPTYTELIGRQLIKHLQRVEISENEPLKVAAA